VTPSGSGVAVANAPALDGLFASLPAAVKAADLAPRQAATAEAVTRIAGDAERALLVDEAFRAIRRRDERGGDEEESEW
jgi:hypothetical protein